MRVLVVEDETKVGCFIKRALEEESYAVDLCEDGAKGLEMALGNQLRFDRRRSDAAVDCRGWTFSKPSVGNGFKPRC